MENQPTTDKIKFGVHNPHGIQTHAKTFLDIQERHVEYYKDGFLVKTVVTCLKTGEDIYSYYPQNPKKWAY